jgi:arylsulfatase A-like enzyme
VLAAIDEIGATATTMIGFFTDHGEHLGDYGLIEKWPSGLDPSLLRNPLILAGAGLPEGRVVDQPVEMIDLLPTLLDLAEIEADHTHFGMSLLEVIDDPSVEHRPFACAEGGFRPSDRHLMETISKGVYEPKARLQREQPELVGTAMVIRTITHTYVHRRHEPDECYDRLADPDESTNLLASAHPPAEATELRDLLFGWLADTSDVIPWVKNPRFPKVPHGWRDQR